MSTLYLIPLYKLFRYIRCSVLKRIVQSLQTCTRYTILKRIVLDAQSLKETVRMYDIQSFKEQSLKGMCKIILILMMSGLQSCCFIVNLTFLPHKVKTQYVHFRSHAGYFLLPWKIPEKKLSDDQCSSKTKENNYYSKHMYIYNLLAWKWIDQIFDI